MVEYIEREYVKSKKIYSEERHECVVPVAEIDWIPSTDVAPVKHGKWVWNPNGMDWGLGAWECSECACRNNNLPMNNKINPLVFSSSKYCPNCGADMRGNSDE